MQILHASSLASAPKSVTQSLRPTNFIPQGDHSSDGGGQFINQKFGLIHKDEIWGRFSTQFFTLVSMEMVPRLGSSLKKSFLKK